MAAQALDVAAEAVQSEGANVKTGRYRVRRSWLGKAILQEEYDFPMIIGGFPDASIRERSWSDVEFDRLDAILFAKPPSQGDAP